MKKFKIELESLEELCEQDNFKLSKQGIINFFSNLKEMIDKFNALKNETLFILNKCILAEINPGKACKNCKNSIEQMKKLEFFIPTFNNYIFSSTEMNYFVNTNRSVVNQLIEIEGYFSIFLDEFDNNVEDAQKLNIELKDFSFNSFEGESGNWNVKGYRKEDDVLRDSFFSTTGFFFQRGYNSDAFDDLIDGYSEGTRELGLLLYDQARIINSLNLLNIFIEELKDKILYCPLNFKERKIETKDFKTNFYFGAPNCSIKLVDDNNQKIVSPSTTNILYTIEQEDLKRILSIKLKSNNEVFDSYIKRDYNAGESIMTINKATMLINNEPFCSTNSKNVIKLDGGGNDRRFSVSGFESFTLFEKGNISYLESKDLVVTYKIDDWKIENATILISEITFDAYSFAGNKNEATLSISIEYFIPKIESFD